MKRALLAMVVFGTMGCAATGEEDEVRESSTPPREPASAPPTGGAGLDDDGDADGDGDGRQDCGSVAKRVVGARVIGSLAGDDAAIFWLEPTAEPLVEEAWTLKSLTFATGTVTTLAENISYGQRLELNDGFVYVLAREGRDILRVARAGGPLEAIVTELSGVDRFVVDDDWLFYQTPELGVTTSIYRMAADGAPASASLFTTHQDLVRAADVGGGYLYVGTSGSPTGEVLRIPVTGGGFELVAADAGSVDDVEVGPDKLWFTLDSDVSATELISIDLMTMLQDERYILPTTSNEWLEATAEAVYFIREGSELARYRADLDLATLATGDNLAEPVVAGECVYYIERTDGIFRVAR